MAEFDIVFIGRGYSVATYLAFSDFPSVTEGKPTKIAILGDTSPWFESKSWGRGYGIINHPARMFLWDQDDRTKLVKEFPSERSELADPVERVLAKRCGDKWGFGEFGIIYHYVENKVDFHVRVCTVTSVELSGGSEFEVKSSLGSEVFLRMVQWIWLKLGQKVKQLYQEAEQLYEGVEKLGQGVEQLGQGVEQLGQGVEQLGQGVEQLGQGVEQLDKYINEELYQEMEQLYQGMGEQLLEMKEQLPKMKEQLLEMKEQLPKMKEQLPKMKEKLLEMKEQLLEMKEQLPKMKEQLPKMKEPLMNNQQSIPLPSIKAKKVIYGGGAGPHRFPTKMLPGNVDDQDKVLDLDAFMRRYGGKVPGSELKKGQRVALVGPNAGLDAFVTILDSKAKPVFFIEQGRRPFWLASKHYAAKIDKDEVVGDDLIEKSKEFIINYKRKTKPEVSSSEEGGELEVSYTPVGGDEVYEKVDLFVYAMGQDPTAVGPFGGGPLKVISADIVNQLEPIYDINHRFSDDNMIIGLRTKGTSRTTSTSVGQGLEVIGAAALIIPSWISRNGEKWSEFSKKAKTIQREMRSLPSLLNQQTLVAADQLGVIRAQIEALTGYDPRAGFNEKAKEFLGDLEKIRKIFDEFKMSKGTAQEVRDGIVKKLIEAKVDEQLLAFGEAPSFEQPGRWSSYQNQLIEKLYKNASENGTFIQAIDFNGADRTAMMVEIATYFPYIKDSDLERVVQGVMFLRDMLPQGVGSKMVEQLNNYLLQISSPSATR